MGAGRQDDGSIRFGLWEKPTKTGGKFYSGKIPENLPAGSYLNVFKNDRRQHGGHPDLNVIVNPPKDATPPPQAEGGEEAPDDDIPF